jgi:hypothetical protein
MKHQTLSLIALLLAPLAAEATQLQAGVARVDKGFAQEDCDCLLAPEWQKLFEEKVTALLQKL